MPRSSWCAPSFGLPHQIVSICVLSPYVPYTPPILSPYIQCAVQIMKLLFTQFSPFSCYCLSVSQHPFWNTLCRCSSRPFSNTEPKTGLRKLRFHLDASGYWSTLLARHGCIWPVQSDGLNLPFVLKATRCCDSSVVLVTGLRDAICSRVKGPLCEMSNGTAVSYLGGELPSSVEVKNEWSCVQKRCAQEQQVSITIAWRRVPAVADGRQGVAL